MQLRTICLLGCLLANASWANEQDAPPVKPAAKAAADAVVKVDAKHAPASANKKNKDEEDPGCD
ncbi:MAG: hypothetical protein ABL892_06795 [Thiobacillaceae bacterium]